MTTEQKFKAAVNVIRNLPKNGPVQQSHHVMLKFYGYYKQATEGPNTTSKPAFWDIVKKAKWDAWSKLGNMDKETAMSLYVAEFKKIVDTIASSNVGQIDESEVNSFYASVPMDDLELLVGPKLARSRSPSPTTELYESDIQELDLTERSPDIGNEKPAAVSKEIPTISGMQHSRPNYNGMSEFVHRNGSIRSEEDDDDEFFLDTIENSDQGSVKTRVSIDDKILKSSAHYSYMNGFAPSIPDDSNNNSNTRFHIDDHETSLHLTKVIVRLQKDLEKVVKSVNLIEQRIGQLQGKMVEQSVSHSHILTSPFISFVLLFTWPVILQLLIFWFRRRK